MRAGPTEGWIVAGMLDGVPAFPALDDDVAGMPYVLRLACDLVYAGCSRIRVFWDGHGTQPSLAPYETDERLKGAALELVTSQPAGDDADAIVIVRADRIYHRDMAKMAINAWRTTEAGAAVVAGSDAIVVTDRARARTPVPAREPGPFGAATTALDPVEGTPPYLAFTASARDRRDLRRAERQLVWSMRKAADGIASKWINRHLSLRITWLIMRTGIHPNHITIFCFFLALTGGIVIGQGGHLAAAIGMLLVNLGSIIDGVDGEIARLKFRFSRAGQWLDTMADDFANIAYITGIAFNLRGAGETWALPFVLFVIGCFVYTQSTQYWLIARVYKSGDLAAIPWAYQSHDFLTAQNEGVRATIAKMMKRDFALTVFVVLALCGTLTPIVVAFSTGCLSFTVIFTIQLVKNLGSIRAARQAASSSRS